MKKIIGAGVAAGIGVIALTLVVPQAAYSAAPSHDRGHGNKYTMAQVAAHNTAADCWSVVDRKVYNLTQWLVAYPTQPIAIPSLCGVDSTAAFNALAVPKKGHHDDDGDDDDRSLRDRGRGGHDDDGDDDHRASASATASATATATASATASASASPTASFPGKGHGRNPWLKSIKRYKIGKLVLVATPSATASATATATATPTATATATATPTATATATATATPSPSPSTFTLAQVAQHNTAANCWTAIGGKVYDMSNYAALHPGGPSFITGLICGKDGTTSFNGQHQGESNPAAVLAGRQIGTLV